jgi:hypothetical protein
MEAEHDERSEFQLLCADAVELCVTVGLMQSVASQWPAEVQRNFKQMIADTRGGLRQRSVEFRDFAESFD